MSTRSSLLSRLAVFALCQCALALVLVLVFAPPQPTHAQDAAAADVLPSAAAGDTRHPAEPETKTVGEEKPPPRDLGALPTPEEMAKMDWLRVVGTVPLPGEPLEDRLIFFFDEPIGSMPEPPLTTSPSIPGHWESAENYLVYDFQRTVSSTTSRLRVELREGLKSVSGRGMHPEHRIFEFLTRPFELESTSLGGIDDVAVTLHLRFSTTVSVDSLGEKLALRDGAGQPLTPEVEALPLAYTYGVRFPADTALPVAVTLARGLRHSELDLAMTRKHSFEYPSPNPLTISSCVWSQASEHHNRIDLRFTTPVRTDMLKDFVQIVEAGTKMEIPFELGIGKPARKIRLETGEDLSDVEALDISIAPGLFGDGLRRLPEAYSTTLQRPMADLRLAYHYWDRRGVAGAVLSLQFSGAVKTDDLEEHLEIEPAVENLRVESGSGRNVLVYGDWQSGTGYRLRLTEGLGSSDGNQKVKKTLDYPLRETPKVSGVGFGYGGKLYFPRRGLGHMTIKARNQRKATVRLHELFPSNIVQAMRYLQGDLTSRQFNESLAQPMAEQEVIFPEGQDCQVSLPLDVTALLPPDRKGIFTLQLDPSSNWQNSKVVVWTDIGALAHWQDDALVLSAHHLFTLEPLIQAKVTVYSSKNQVMGAVNTDGQGIAQFAALDTSLGTPAVAVVETEGDYTFLELKARTDDPTGFDASMPRFDREGYDAFLYTDRDLYRPGETIHARCLMRTGYGDAVGGVPFELRLLNPRGDEIFREAMTLSEWGGGGKDIATKASWSTGACQLQVRVPGSKTAIQSHTIHLEEFVPNRIEAFVAVDPGRWLPNAACTIEVEAKQLFGGPASDRKCEAAVMLRPGSFKSEKWPEYRFTNNDEFAADFESLGEAKTNEAGKATFEYTYRPSSKATSPLQATVRGQVFELGGRPVTASAEATVFPSELCLGIAAAPTETGDVVKVFALAIRPDESPAALAEAQVTLEQEHWHYSLRHLDGHNRPTWSKSFSAVETKTVVLTEGKGETEFPVNAHWGRYRLRVHAAETPQFSTLTFEKRWRGIEFVESIRPSLIQLTLNQERFRIGDEIEVRIDSPFDGRALAVLQGDALQQAIPLEITDGAGMVRFTATRAHYPNVWVEVTVAHAVDQERPGVYPFSSFAMVNVPIEDPSRRIGVTYSALPEEVRPAQNVTIGIETQDNAGQPVSAEVTLAAVDEGIHGILGYENPNPYEWFQRVRQPDFRRAHYYDKVSYDFEAPPIGGGLMAKRLGKDSPTIGDNWIKPVALWSGVVTTDAAGKASVTLPVPEFNGRLRLVAVASGAASSGAGSADLFVRRPYILRTSMPRFTLPGDQFQCRATVFNQTENACRARVGWSVEGALAAGAGSRELALEAGKDTSFVANFTAGNALGQGAIVWSLDVVGEDGQVLEHMETREPLPVLEPAGYESHHELHVLEAGETRTFKNSLFAEDARTDTRISVGANPMLRLRDALGYVVGYPYGCVEQTTSRCMPLYLLRKSETLLEDSLEEPLDLDVFLHAGIDRLFSMQTPSGGIAFWPGGRTPYPYGSVYACHFLTLANLDRELSVPKEDFQRLQEYVRRRIEDWEDSSASGHYLRAYAAYVLALGGDLKALESVGRFNDVVLPKSARYLLAAALAINTHDAERVARYLEEAPSEDVAVRETCGNLNSGIRNTSVMLMALLQMEAPEEAIQEKVNVLLDWLDRVKSGYHGRTTQDTAFAVTALGQYLTRVEVDSSAASATVTGPQGEQQVQGVELFRSGQEGPGVSYTVANTGAARLFVNFTTAGIPLQPRMERVEKGLGIKRTYLDETGKAVAAPSFEHGSTYLVRLDIKCENTSDHVVIADLLPAGFEIENPRLDPDALAGHDLAAAATPSHVEIRDDRLVVAFERLKNGAHCFYYLVRAVTPGSFQHPAVHAECMYKPEVRGTSLPGRVTVE